MKRFTVPIWQTAPFIRLTIPLMVGILLQWYLQFSFSFIIIASACFVVAYLLFLLFPIAAKFRLGGLQGLCIQLIVLCVGLFATWSKDIRHTQSWYGNHYKQGDYLVVKIDEPLIEKTKTYKANGYIENIIQNDSVINCNGKVILYFSKTLANSDLHYGDKILINKNLQSIKNSGNPGSFNYQQYAAFQQIFANVFLKDSDWVNLHQSEVNPFNQFIFSARAKILSVLQKNINADKDELGIAEALLIGYTNDLDKDLVQAYSNTGVVHIIAISGMHLGLIYVMLTWLFARIPFIKKIKLLELVLVLSCLWLFSLLTGASASVLRSAVMFTFIAVGKVFYKQVSIYNSLAVSAFVLLCYNPFMLWDVGFQLSYFAVLGILIFQKSVYNLFYVKQKWIDEIWKLASVSIAAQILTFPICIYYFHQFTNLFLITNVIAVPLSTIILFVEIAVVAFAWIPLAGGLLGKCANWLVWMMNKIIIYINSLPIAVWDKIPASVLSTIALYAVVICASVWLLKKNKTMFTYALIFVLLFAMLNVYANLQANAQQKIIVYNVPNHQAIDFVNGHNYSFVGDSILLQDALLQNFHLKPSRIKLQLNHRIDNGFAKSYLYQLGNKRIVLLDSVLHFDTQPTRIKIDALIISKNPSLSIDDLNQIFDCKQYVFDASNSLWKIAQWKKACEDLHLRCFSVPNDGAFVLDCAQ